MRNRDQAICIRTADYSETSQVVSFLTRDAGVVRLIAKGTKRPKSKSGGAIDLLTEGDLVYTARSAEALGTLVEFTESASHAALRRDARRLNAALYAIELVGEILPVGDAQRASFDLLHNTLGRLGEADAPLQPVLAYFQWRLLQQVGLLGDMTACVVCGRPVTDTEAWFSSREGGLLCGGCEAGIIEKYRLDAAARAGLAALTAVQRGPARRARRIALPDSQAVAANRVLAYHVREQLGKPLRMARFAIG
ncbi:MAG: DNA repair protein RecO [Phycisphaerae bacterium]|nr:DNA repair protein RecO [Phycisphaerae bacterium]